MTPEILYIDVGLHSGKELGEFISICHRNGWNFTACGFEACFNSAIKCWAKYSAPNVHILNLAITSRVGIVKLYHDNAEGQGNSIYRSKNNVTDNHEIVFGAPFSEVLKYLQNHALNILRFNIEGAEWDLMHDLTEKGLHKGFDLFLGEPNGEDIAKCGMDQAAYQKLLKDNDITILPWCLERPGYIDLEKWIKEYFTSPSGPTM